MEPLATGIYDKSAVSLKDKPPSTALLRQAIVYSVSFFLPPLGIWPAIKYLRQPGQKSKNIGITALVLTAASIIITIYLSISLLNSYTKDLSSQLNIYKDLGL